MGTVTVRLPDDKHQRLKLMAKRQGTSLNKLFEELTTNALAELDVETRFRARASRGNPAKALEILNKIS